MLRWTRVSFCLFETPANVKASYPVWLRIFQRKKLSHSRVCLVVFADYHTGSWGFMQERCSSVCTLSRLFSPLSLSPSVHVQYTAYAWVCHSHAYATAYTVGGGDETPHPLPAWAASLARGALWEGGSGAVRGGTVKPDVDVLFAQAGQLRSQGLSCYICSRPQPQTNCLSEIKKTSERLGE